MDDNAASPVYTVSMESPRIPAGPNPGVVTRIHVLAPEVAKRIAAGEVIDRPAAALRELLDNALDSGARDIVVEMEGGGADFLRVVDNGSGMDRDDLALSVLPHATSKIGTLDDLLSLSTLGFRGEALSSIAAVANLEIVSATDDDEAWRLESSPGGGSASVSPWRGSRGTAVTVRDLFASFPARKKFLKRGAAEASACRAVFVDKALAFPAVSFRLFSGGKPLLILEPGSLAGRVLSATAVGQPPELFRELIASGTGFGARVVAGLPAVYRNDRRHIQVFVNGRRVQEYGIAQALEYAYRGALPGGAWPFVWAFVQVDPEYADFNIHPAKKEVRLKNLDDIRAGLIRAIRDYLAGQVRQSIAFPAPERGWFVDDAPPSSSIVPGPSSRAAMADAVSAIRAAGAAGAAGATGATGAASRGPDPRPDVPAPQPQRAGQGTEGFRYIGRTLGVFLAFEAGDEFILLDQHAAHERLLYDEIMAGRAVSQDLLVPIVYEAESDAEDEYIARHAGELESAGFRLAREGRSWMLEAAPAMLPEAMTGALFELLRSRPDPAELLRQTAAQAACRAAVKDGDELDESGAVALIRAAMALPDPHCPHGRPIWLRLSRDDLYRAVMRLV